MSINRSVRSHGQTPGAIPGQSPSSQELVQFTYQLAVFMAKIDQQVTRLEEHFKLRREQPLQAYHQPAVGEFDEGDEGDDEFEDYEQLPQEAYQARGVAQRQREPWLWVGGVTKPHKELFKAEGGRWSSRHQKWYFVNRDSLPVSCMDLPGISWEVTL